MGLSPQAAAQRLGFTQKELQQALHHADFEVMLADVAAQLAEGIEATNANLVAAATCMLEQLIYQAEPRVLLYLVHCAAEGKNGLLLIAQATTKAMAKLKEVKAEREAKAAEPPLVPEEREPEPDLRVSMRRINLDLRDRLLAVYASIAEARALEAANLPEPRKAKPRAGLLYGAVDELMQAALAQRRPQPVPADSS
jgi:hypothetical protein